MFCLTRCIAKKMEQRETDYFVWDEDLAGFGIRVYPSGRKAYLMQYRAARKSRRRAIGQHGVLTADDARKEARKLLGEVARGGNAAEERQCALKASTITSFCERFLAEFVAHHCSPRPRKPIAAI